jgi:hypothetical protein
MRRLAGIGAALLAVLVLMAGCGGGAAAANSRLDGVWTQTVVRAQLLATHAPDYLQPQNLKLDAGRYRLVLSHGRATLSKRNPISTFHSSGTFTVHGNTMAFRWTNAVEHDLGSPPDRFCSAGSGCDPPWRLRWSLYRGVLTFSPLSRSGSTFEVPPSIRAAPWRRA